MKNKLDLYKIKIYDDANIDHIIPLKIITEDLNKILQQSIKLKFTDKSSILKINDHFTLFGLNSKIVNIYTYADTGLWDEDLIATIHLYNQFGTRVEFLKLNYDE
jgi:hypothetical protein